jgi:Glycosyltransferase family 87
MFILNFKKKINNFFKLAFFTEKKYIISLWFVVTLVSVIKQLLLEKYNNYNIFKGVFYHTINKLDIYGLYPSEYFDQNHYGPIFSLFIAPFALLPDYLGLPLWGLFNAGVLIYAIMQLPLKSSQINAVLWICLHEFLTTLLGVQFNPIMAAIIILSFVNIEKSKDVWATMFIVLGLFIKLYGIVGLAFFFFSKNKIKFILSFIMWSIIFFILPMVITSPEFIINTYTNWYHDLLAKNTENTSLTSYQDICLMGMVRRIFNDISIPNLPFLIIGLILFGLQYLRIKEYKQETFRLMLLASTMIFTVIFSTGSESPTYIIAFIGVAIWFVIQPKPISNFYLFLFIFAMVLTSFSPSDLVPRFIRDQYIKPYALKALPCVIIWFLIIYEMYFFKFKDYISKNNSL